MTNVQFDEQNVYTSRKILGEPTVPGMTRILVKAGLVKDGKQAEYILIGVIIVSLLISFFILYTNVQKSRDRMTPAEEQIFIDRLNAGQIQNS